MQTLEWCPQQPNTLLKLSEDGEPIKAGETFEVSDTDAEAMLENPEVQKTQKNPTHSRKGTASNGESKGSQETNSTGDADAS